MLANGTVWSARPDVARTLVAAGRCLFGFALVGLGVEHLVFGEFVMGRAPAWPEGLPGGALWAQVSGVAFIAIGLAILHGRYARAAAILAAVLIGSWALLRHVPVILAAPVLSNAWTTAGKALTFTGGALAIAAAAPRGSLSPPPRGANTDAWFTALGRIALGIFLFVAGIQHFLYRVRRLAHPAVVPGRCHVLGQGGRRGADLRRSGTPGPVDLEPGRTPVRRDGVLVVLDRAPAEGVRQPKRHHCRLRSPRRFRHCLRARRGLQVQS